MKKITKFSIRKCIYSAIQHQQKPEKLYHFTTNKPINHIYKILEKVIQRFKNYITLTLRNITIAFTDENGRPLEMEEKSNLKLLINKKTQ